ncbi:MAG: MFS transporter [Flavobacteriales bacterium]|jgi:MFS family permease|tara:strand:+ start:3836 stop:5026 length:1191 start_codon:yes stop_codon:yes gene_type:complete
MIRFPHPNILKLFIIKGTLWFMIIMPIIVLFFQDNGLSLQRIMILQACYSLSVGLMEIPSGYAADILGRRKTLILGCILAFIGFSLFSISYNFWWFLAAEILLGLGNSFISGADTALMYDSLLEVKAEDRFLKYEGRSISIGNFSEAAAGILGGFLAAISFRYPAYAQVIVAFLAIPFAISLTEPTIHKDRLKSAWKSIFKVVHFSLVEHKTLRTHIIYSSVIGVSTLMMAWLAQPFLKDIGVNMKNYGLVWALLNIIVGVFAFRAHYIEKRFTELTSLYLIGFITVSTYFIIGIHMSYLSLFILFIFYANRGYATPLLRNYINRYTESNVRATVMSVRSFIIRISFAIIAPFIGWIADNHSLNTAFFTMGIIGTVVSSYCLIWFSKNKNDQAINY